MRKRGFQSTTVSKVIDRNSMSSFLYEAKPFACLAFSAYAASLQYIGGFGKAAALVLITCSVAIVYMRARHRGLI